MHARTVQCDGYARDDGLWDIEASIIDRKPFRYTEPYRGVREVGSEVHHMAIRLTIGKDMVIRSIEVVQGEPVRNGQLLATLADDEIAAALYATTLDVTAASGMPKLLPTKSSKPLRPLVWYSSPAWSDS